MPTAEQYHTQSHAAGGYSMSAGTIDQGRWQDLLSLFNDASIYQTRAFGEACWKEKQLSHFVLSHGGEAAAIAQVRIITIPLIQKGVAYVRWGPLWRRKDRANNPDLLRRAIAGLVEEYSVKRGLLLRVIPNLYVEEDCEWSGLSGIWSELGFKPYATAKPYHTLRLDLTPSLETIRKQLDQKWRNQLNGSERNGLNVIAGTGLDLYEKFTSIYHSMMERKKFETTVDINEFRVVQQRLREDARMRIALAEKDGEILNGLVASGAGDTAIYLLGATTEAGMKSKGAYLLQWRMIEHFKQEGRRWYDLGGVNPVTNPGVYHFKKGITGQEATQPGCYERSGGWFSGAFVKGGEKLRNVIKLLRQLQIKDRLAQPAN